ncbi:MAG: formate dehydrogenase subunit alpha [Candidatus Didemnitutus sp.]|nr:formate dehydrogenase subunit alpha [Candidatus Didemnitutus sp.]
MKTVSLTFNDRSLTAPAGVTVLEAARASGIDIPHLCFDPRVEAIGGCRLCVVKVEGMRGLVTSCTTPVAEGMKIVTDDDEIALRRKNVLELILSDHCSACTTCDKNGACKLQDYSYRYQADQERFGAYVRQPPSENFTSRNKGIHFDPDKCIRCGLCVKYCETVQMSEALTFAWRANRTEVTTPFKEDLHLTTCESCGGCVRVCPVGAMLDKRAVGRGRDSDLTRVKTICPYCGVGCQMDLLVDRQRNRIVRATSSTDAPINGGNLCVKGHYGFDYVSSPERLTHPLIRTASGFQRATWEEAIGFVGRRLREIRAQHGPDALAFISSARCPNEENYLVQKLARAAAGTNNVDNCATSCHAPTVAGLAASFGSGAMTNSVREIKDCDVMFLIGANPTEAHPVIALEMKRALRRGAKLIVCDPRRTWLAQRALIHLQHRPGSDNMLLNALMRCILDEGLADEAFVADRCEGFEEFERNLEAFSVEEAAKYCGVEAGQIRAAARLYATGKPSAIFYTLGITEHSCGTDNVKNIANLAMLTGQIGKWASGVNPLRGQNNVQGACDMGAMANKLPGYQDWADPVVRAKFEQAWGVPLPQTPGGKVPLFVSAAGRGELKALYIVGQDVVSTEPNQTRVIEDLAKLELLVCQEIFMSETAKLAHVILPSACWAEKDGTFSASERRMQLIRKAVEPPGEAKADWEILCLVSTAMGYPMHYESPAQVFDEMASLTPLFGGMSHQRIGERGLQWPCPTAEHPGTTFLHEGKFTRGKGRFHAITFQAQKEEPCAEYPLILSTGRTLYNYNCGSMTRKADVINQRDPENFVEIHPETAARYGIERGEKIVVRTRRGKVTGRAAVGERVRPDLIWMPFHFTEEPTNNITNDVFDPVTATAEYKCCAAQIEKL